MLTNSKNGDFAVRWENRDLILAEGNCGHCKAFVAFRKPDDSSPHFSHTQEEYDEGSQIGRRWTHHFVVGICPRPTCRKPTIIYQVLYEDDSMSNYDVIVETRELVYPRLVSTRSELPATVPEKLRNLYNEAARIEQTSPNGAAFLARRILEQVLRDHLGTKRRLTDLIDDYMTAEALPGTLHQLMHDVREFGNIAGHPGQSTDGDWIDVDGPEATYTLDVVAELLDYIYVRPELQRDMRERWQSKKRGESPSKTVLIEQRPPSKDVGGSPSNDDLDNLPF